MPPIAKSRGHLAADGYNVTRAVRGQDGLWKFLTEASGLKGVEFPRIPRPPSTFAQQYCTPSLSAKRANRRALSPAYDEPFRWKMDLP